MRRTSVSRFLAILAALFLAAPLCRGAAPAEDSAAALERLEQELVAAIAQTDLATYDRIVADDYFALDPSGKPLSKAEIMASYRSGSRRYSGLEIYDVSARVFGETAVVSAKTKGLRREGDRDIPNRVRYIRVFARRGGRWQAVTQMSAPMPESSDETKSR